MTAEAFLRDNPAPSREEIREAVSGHLCRCTGYHNIVEGVALAAERLAADGPGPAADGDGGPLKREGPRMSRAGGTWVGARVPRNEDARLLTGRAQFVEDVEPPGALHVAFVRSDLPAGRLRGLDVKNARRRTPASTPSSRPPTSARSSGPARCSCRRRRSRGWCSTRARRSPSSASGSGTRARRWP